MESCLNESTLKPMSWSDPIVDEVRRVRDAYAARFNYDLRAIYRDLKEQEKRSGRKLVSYCRASTEAESKQAFEPTVPVPTVAGDTPSPQDSATVEL